MRLLNYKCIHFVLLFITILFFSISDCLSQNNARSLFTAGMESYEDENYSQAYQQFNEVREILDEPKLRLQPWLVKASFQNRKYFEANQHLQAYLSLNPNTDLVEYQEMQEYLDRIQRYQRRSRLEYERMMDITDADRFIRALQSYVSSYQDGPYMGYLFDKMERVDQQAFNNIDPDNIYSINNYLETFRFKISDDISKPGYVYSWTPSNEKDALILRDDYYFNQAVEEGTLQAYNRYLDWDQSYRRTSNIDTIELLKDDILFKEAISEGTKYAYQTYLDRHVNHAENNNYEEIKRLFQEVENQEEIAAIEQRISVEEENLRFRRGEATKNYFKGILGLGMAGAGGYYAYNLYDKYVIKERKFNDEDYLYGTLAAMGVIFGLEYFYTGFKRGSSWSKAARRTKEDIRELENDIQQLSLIPIIDPVNNSYQLALRINF